MRKNHGRGGSTDLMIALNERMEYLQAHFAWTSIELISRLNVSRATFYALKGQNKFSPKTVRKLATVFDVPIHVLTQDCKTMDEFRGLVGNYLKSPSTDSSLVGDKLRALREMKNTDPRDIAIATEIPRRVQTDHETGRSPITKFAAKRYADFYGIPVEYLSEKHSVSDVLAFFKKEPEPESLDIVQRMKQVFTALGLDAPAAAAKMSADVETVEAILDGRREPTWADVQRFVKAFNVEPGSLF